MADEPLPECRVEARNTSANPETRVPDGPVTAPPRLPPPYEKKGPAYVELAPAIVAEPAGRPVADVLHTAVSRRPSPAR